MKRYPGYLIGFALGGLLATALDMSPRVAALSAVVLVSIALGLSWRRFP